MHERTVARTGAGLRLTTASEHNYHNPDRLRWIEVRLANPLTPVADTDQPGPQRLPAVGARMLGDVSPSAGQVGLIWHARGPIQSRSLASPRR